MMDVHMPLVLATHEAEAGGLVGHELETSLGHLVRPTSKQKK
jgi:hypothetical protein